jgi:hypothetical protein
VSVEKACIGDKVILDIFVKEGWKVYRCGSRTNNAGDFDITNNNQECAFCI